MHVAQNATRSFSRMTQHRMDVACKTLVDHCGHLATMHGRPMCMWTVGAALSVILYC